MKPAPFTYHAPDSLDDCLELLAEHGDAAALIAGGQSLLPLMRFRMAMPEHVVSLRNIGGELAIIRRTEAGISIGAMVTYADVERSPDVRELVPALLKAIPLIAHVAVRTRGTPCGNLCNADPASELPAVALALDARMHLRGPSGLRVVPAGDFFQGPYMTARESDEVLVCVEFPRRPPDEMFAIKEIVRLAGGFPMAGIALAVRKGASSGTFASASVACFGVHAVQSRLPAVEAMLLERGCSPEAVRAAADLIDETIEPPADAFASAEYRRAAVKTLFERCVRAVCDGEEGR